MYAWKRAWPLVVGGLALAALLGVAGLRHPVLLWVGAGVAIATGVGFAAYYISL